MYWQINGMVLEWIVGATVLVSLASLSGILVLSRGKLTERLLFFFVSFAAGTLLGTAFLHLIPEAVEEASLESGMMFALAGILVFFVIEKVIHWHHHHSSHKDKKEIGRIKPLGYLNLVGDGLHNFFDGVAIAAAFLVSIPTGITTTVAVLMHEIPQEIGDYSLLIYSGFGRMNALIFNLISALIAVVGALVFFYFNSYVENLIGIALAFTAGMFIYIASVDLVPEIHKETDPSRSLLQLISIVLGVMLIYGLGILLEH